MTEIVKGLHDLATFIEKNKDFPLPVMEIWSSLKPREFLKASRIAKVPIEDNGHSKCFRVVFGPVSIYCFCIYTTERTKEEVEKIISS